MTGYSPKSLCTIQQTKPRQQQRSPAMLKAIGQLVSGPPEMKPSDKKLRELLYEFSDVISVNGSDLGLATVVQHEIKHWRCQTYKPPPRRLPFHQHRTVCELVSDMLDE